MQLLHNIYGLPDSTQMLQLLKHFPELLYKHQHHHLTKSPGTHIKQTV